MAFRFASKNAIVPYRPLPVTLPHAWIPGDRYRPRLTVAPHRQTAFHRYKSQGRQVSVRLAHREFFSGHPAVRRREVFAPNSTISVAHTILWILRIFLVHDSTP